MRGREEPAVVAVVVSHDRKQLLLECLDALERQTRPLARIVVVDNASTDGSAQAAELAHPDADVIAVGENLGGAGGFALGMARAVVEHDAELVWVMDDDTIPTPTALEELLVARAAAGPLRPRVLASRVVWTDGSDHPMNVPRERPFASSADKRRAREAGLVLVRSASFVSCLVDAAAVRALGLPVADYFIWNDDFEYTTRLLRDGAGVFVPGSVVVHKTRALASTDLDPGERFYYEVRNKVWTFRGRGGLTGLERLVYGASTARRWLRTLARSHDRRLLLRCLVRGMRDGLVRRPRDNAEVLGALGWDAVVAAVGEGSR